jgi:hypothetical protein
MYHKIHVPTIRLIAVIFLVVTVNNVLPAEPKLVDYDKPVTLTGVIIREWDMSFVDSDQSPLQDPKEVARIVATHPVDKSRPHTPVLHLILHLDTPITVQKGADDGLHPEERAIYEIDLGGGPADKLRIVGKALGKGHFVVTGKLWHAETVHHLRNIMMEVTDIKPLK